MLKKDFSIRREVETMARDKGFELSSEQVDEVIGEIEDYETFVSCISIFVTKGIYEILQREGVAFDRAVLEEQLQRDRIGINPNDI